MRRRVDQGGEGFYRGVRWLFLLIARPMFRLKVEGAELLPSSGPGVVVAAHRSWLDPVCVGAACPRPVRFLILETVYRRRWGRWFFRLMRSIPVTPGRPGQVAALRRALRHLESGGLIGVFPEGRVVGVGQQAALYPGAALLATRSRAPVIPVQIRGSARAWPHGRPCPRPAPVHVRIGNAIRPPAAGGRQGLEALVRRIAEEIQPVEEP